MRCKLHSSGCRARRKLQTIAQRKREEWQGGIFESGDGEPLGIVVIDGVRVGEQQLLKRKHNVPTEKLGDPKGSTPVCPVTYAQVKTESALLCSFSATPAKVAWGRGWGGTRGRETAILPCVFT